jgi:hypothetical protein
MRSLSSFASPPKNYAPLCATLDKQDTPVESYLVESAFAFTVPLDLQMHIENHRPKALFELDPVLDLLKPAPVRGSTLRLQSIRLRYRIRNDDDKSRSIIRLGWNPEPWGDEGFGAPPLVRSAEVNEDPWWVRLTGIDPKLPNWLKTSALALELGIGIERVRRVGSEGIMELHHRLYPDPYDHKAYTVERAKALEIANHRAITEMLVPPVALFSQ